MYLNVGKIVNTQGIKGDVRVISTTDFREERYKKGNQLNLLLTDGTDLTVEITSHRRHKNFDIVHFKGFDSINDVEKFRDGQLRVAKEDIQELSEDEYYYHEIIGLKVFTEDQELLGTITEILSPGANDVWVVQGDKKAHYIPYIEDVVQSVDLDSGSVIIHVLEGLIDDEN